MTTTNTEKEVRQLAYRIQRNHSTRFDTATELAEFLASVYTPAWLDDETHFVWEVAANWFAAAEDKAELSI